MSLAPVSTTTAATTASTQNSNRLKGGNILTVQFGKVKAYFKGLCARKRIQHTDGSARVSTSVMQKLRTRCCKRRVHHLSTPLASPVVDAIADDASESDSEWPLVDLSDWYASIGYSPESSEENFHVSDFSDDNVPQLLDDETDDSSV